MNNNLVMAIFKVESEAFQAFNELRKAPEGENYVAAEGALIRNKDNVIEVCDSFGIEEPGTGTATGMVIGSLVGILGGPIGVILGASAGAWAGASADVGYAADTMSSLSVIANKIYEGETAIVALVGEEEPAFDAVFADYKVTIVRYDAVDIADDVDRMYELQADISNQVWAEAKADRKAARKAKRDEHHAKIKERLDNLVDKIDSASDEEIVL